MGFEPSSALSFQPGLCGGVILTFCDFKMLRLQEPKMQIFCESRILGFDDLMIQ